ncbi:Cadherin-related family member 3 [Manis javanica]|nr:Cadherin-related family member 3 [Manis javanica]
MMPFFHLLLVLAAAPDVLALPSFAIENASPLLENASEHTQVAIITVSVSPPVSLVGGPAIISANPVPHPFVLSHRSMHQWELLTTGVPRLDFEMVTLYSLTIYAKDDHGTTASETILIQIADVNEPPTFTGSLARGDQVTVTIIVEVAPANDFSPVFKATHYSFSVPETSGAFYKVGRVTAIDEDQPLDCVTYRIASGDIQTVQRFWIHPLSGMIELTTQPDYETVKQYNLIVEGVDCDKFHPRTAVTTVTVDIKDENDEAPVCTPSLYKTVILDNVVAGTNINGFKLNCHDRDSQDYEMRFEMVSGNENHHFGFDPTRGSNTPKLIVKNPFNFESGAELKRHYHLLVHIIDDNLKYGKATKPRTGTAIIDIYVTRANMPLPPTTSSEQRKGLTIVYTAINTYKSSDWYIPFIFTLMAVFFAGLVSWVCFLFWKYGNAVECCHKTVMEASKLKPSGIKYSAGARNQKEKIVTENINKKLEVLTETIVYETMFDGEAIDPVSGNVYKYNSRTGARKWKKPPWHQYGSLAHICSVSEAHPSEESTFLKIPMQG